MTDDSDKAKKTEALSTAPQSSEGGVPGLSSKTDQDKEKKNEEGSSSDAPQGSVASILSKPYYEDVKPEWSAPLQELVKMKQATTGLGTMLHDAEVNRRLLWSKLTSIELDCAKSLRKSRELEKYVTETYEALRRTSHRRRPK